MSSFVISAENLGKCYPPTSAGMLSCFVMSSRDLARFHFVICLRMATANRRKMAGRTSYVSELRDGIPGHIWALKNVSFESKWEK